MFSKRFEPGDKVTCSGTEYLCNSCLEQCLSINGTPVDVGNPCISMSSPGRSADDDDCRANVNSKADAETTGNHGNSVSAPSTPARLDNSSLMDGHLSSPILDYSSDGEQP